MAGHRVWTSCIATTVAFGIACTPAERLSDPVPLDDRPALALDGVIVLDPVNGSSGPATVVLQGDRIVAVLEDGGGSLPDRVERIDASGRYLVPGLWDLHTHLATADEHAPPLLVTQGVTGVRDMGAKLEEIDGLRDRIGSRAVLGPRIVRAGPTLNGAPNAPHHRVIDSAQAAREAVEDLKLAGVDMLKTHNATGREAYFALLEAARSASLAVVGHVPTAVAPSEACAGGQASIEHIATIFEGTYLSSFESELEAFRAMPAWLEAEAPALVRCFAEHQTLFVPTLRAYELRAQRAAVYDDPDPRWRYVSAEGYRRWREEAEPTEVDRRPDFIELRQLLVEIGIGLVRLLHEAGAPVGAGTDLASTGVLPGFDLHAEIRLLERAGLTPRAALRAATRGPGVPSGGDPLQGQIVAGAPADLVVLGSNAFESLDALQAIQGVLLRGEYYDRAALDALLASLERPPPGARPARAPSAKSGAEAARLDTLVVAQAARWAVRATRSRGRS